MPEADLLARYNAKRDFTRTAEPRFELGVEVIESVLFSRSCSPRLLRFVQRALVHPRGLLERRELRTARTHGAAQQFHAGAVTPEPAIELLEERVLFGGQQLDRLTEALALGASILLHLTQHADEVIVESALVEQGLRQLHD